MSTTKVALIVVSVAAIGAAAWYLGKPETDAEKTQRLADERTRTPLVFSMPLIVNVGGRYMVLPNSGG